MTRIGIIGLGMMGRTHLEAYQKLGAAVVALCDPNPQRLAGDLSGTAGNILSGGAQHIDTRHLHLCTDFHELVALNQVDLVDICVPTPQHEPVALAALAADKHVICEKPLGLDSVIAGRIAAAARKSAGSFLPAMCMRFWPQWAWLKQAVAEGRYGPLRGLSLRRLAAAPGGWFADGRQSGGALLDLHIHDTDFILYLLGSPRSVASRGYVGPSGRIDQIVTHYEYSQVPLVVAEGGWLTPPMPFQMRYTARFERATAEFEIARRSPLMLYRDGAAEPIDCGPDTGYEAELRYFLQCLAEGRRPTLVTADDAVEAIRILEAEERSVRAGTPVPLGRPAETRIES